MAHDAGYANLGTTYKHPDNQSIALAEQDLAAAETQRTAALVELTATNWHLNGQLANFTRHNQHLQAQLNGMQQQMVLLTTNA